MGMVKKEMEMAVMAKQEVEVAMVKKEMEMAVMVKRRWRWRWW